MSEAWNHGSMRISDVKTYILGTAWRNLTYVEVHTDEGLVGVGEVRMLNHSDALIGYLAEAAPNHVLGSDPFQIEDLVARMFRNDYARAGEIAMSAISTVEIACWDIVGKALNQPVYRLLGGQVRDRIKAYAPGTAHHRRRSSDLRRKCRTGRADRFRLIGPNDHFGGCE